VDKDPLTLPSCYSCGLIIESLSTLTEGVTLCRASNVLSTVGHPLPKLDCT